MGLKDATIVLDNQWATYYAGQTVNGRIDYVFDSVKKVRGIHVQFKGEAQTSWSEKASQRDAEGQTRDVQKQCSGKEEYFSINYYILGSKTGNEIEIPAGPHSYNFTCTLPPSLPSSFEGEFGYIRYTVKVTLDRPWKFDQETKTAFTVITPLDLNLNPSYREPIHMQMEKTFCCWCCASAPMSIDVRAPVNGYTAGQKIPLQVHVENKSNVQLHLVKIQLRKLVTYRVTIPESATKKIKTMVAETKEGPVTAGDSKEWALQLEIPPVPPSNLVNCGLIDLDYELKVECVVSGAHMNLSDKKYVTIGTVPLLGAGNTPTIAIGAPTSPDAKTGLPSVQPALGENLQNLGGDGPQMGFVMPSAPPAPAPSAPSGPSLYPALSEPVFAESPYNARNITDATDSQYTRISGRADFAPRYPTYGTVLPPQ